MSVARSRPTRFLARGLLALAVGLASGCTWTHRCTVPNPVVEAAPGPRLPGAVEVRYAPPAVAPESIQEIGGLFSPDHRIVVSADAPTRALFDRLAASMFERTAPPGPADAVLEIRLDRFLVGVVPFQGNFSAVGYRATLRSADGTEIASFEAEGASTVAGALRHIGFCGASAEAVAVAMQEAGAALLRKVSGSEPMAAWLAARGKMPVVLAVKPLEAYAEPSAAGSVATAAAEVGSPGPPVSGPQPPLAIPVRAGPPPAPLPPRSLRLRVGAAQLRPEETAGKLEGASNGLAVTAFAGGQRVLPWLFVDVDAEFATRSFSAAHVPHLTGFGPRATLQSTSMGLGARASPPVGGRPVIEPWLGASARIAYTRLEVTYFGGLSGGDAIGSAWSVAADVGGGLDLFVGGPWVLGIDLRWRFGRASVAPLGSVGIGGLLVGGSLGAAFP